jgi:flavorubredoxin
MTPIEVKKGLFWVGAVDWNLRDFHGYSTDKGSSYNSYLLIDDKVTLFDTVKKEFLETHLDNIRKLIEPSKIDYIVVNHVEMDHSGCLPAMVEIVKPRKIFCSRMGESTIREHFRNLTNWNIEVVDDGAEIGIGKRKLRFYEARMLHWPDSMIVHIVDDRVLISNDIFGEHWATSERFDDEVDYAELMRQSAKYYANIVLPYSPIVQKLLARVRELNLEVDIIAPDHGVVWRKHIGSIIEAYDRWSGNTFEKKALVIYGTMWRSTEKMAYSIADGLISEGVSVRVLNVGVTHRSDIMTEVLDAKAIVVGSPTLNNGILPGIADVLTYMKGLRPVNRIGASFGSYGWGGEAVKILNEALDGMKVKLVDDGVRAKFVPFEEDLRKCFELGVKVAKAIKGN